MLWTVEEIILALKELNPHVSVSGDIAITGVFTNHNELIPGGIFIAMKGAKADGHDFVKDAFEKGASLAIVYRIPEGLEEANLVIVDDTFEALNALAIYSRKRFKGKVIAVTGSAGKTTLKNFLHKILSHFGKAHANIKTYNNYVGVPLTLSNMPRDCDFAVIEIGINQDSEMESLAKITRPDIGIITIIGESHLEFLKTVENVAIQKSNIWATAPDYAVLPADSKQYELLMERAQGFGVGKIVSFGKSNHATYQLVDADLEKETSKIKIRDAHGKEINYIFGAPGGHMAMNSVILFAVLDILNLSMSKNLELFENLRASEERGNIVKLNNGVTLINECYNANPISVKAALELQSFYEGKKIAILGDMKELGENSRELHEGLMENLDKVDVLITCGVNMQYLHNKFKGVKYHYETSNDICNDLEGKISGDSVIMVKGSLSMKMKAVVDKIYVLCCVS